MQSPPDLTITAAPWRRDQTCRPAWLSGRIGSSAPPQPARCAEGKAPPDGGAVEGRKEEGHTTFTVTSLPDREGTVCDLLHTNSENLGAAMDGQFCERVTGGGGMQTLVSRGEGTGRGTSGEEKFDQVKRYLVGRLHLSMNVLHRLRQARVRRPVKQVFEPK